MPVGTRGLQLVDRGDGEVLDADPGLAGGVGEQRVRATTVGSGPLAGFEDGGWAEVDSVSAVMSSAFLQLQHAGPGDVPPFLMDVPRIVHHEPGLHSGGVQRSGTTDDQ